MNYYDMYGNPVGMERWSQLLTQPKHVAEDYVTLGGQRFHVSTVWLGLDHNFMPGGPPIIFETMIFADDGSFEDLYCVRYSTREQALAGHRRAIRWLRRLVRDVVRTKTRKAPLIHNGGKPKVLA